MPLKVSDLELVWADDKLVRQRLSEKGFDKDEALENLVNSDRTTHVYEGGFKIWDCCYDLCQLVDSESADVKGKRVLELLNTSAIAMWNMKETKVTCHPLIYSPCQQSLVQLGCGAGLPGILCALRGASHVTFHDFNECVMQCFTRENLLLNGVDESQCSLVSGPWTDFQSSVQPRSYVAKSFVDSVPALSVPYDVILTSETIYNPDDYKALHDAFDYALSPNGVIWVAAKIFYFGVGGNVPNFIEFLSEKGVFKVTTKQSIEADVPRAILEIRK